MFNFKFPVVTAGIVIFCLAGCQPANQQQVSTIEVNGQGRISVEPDQLKFSILVERRGKDSQVSKDQVTRISQQIIEHALALGVDKNDIRSMTINVHPWTEWKDGQQKQLGFVVNQNISVTLKDFNQYPQLLDEALSIGASSINGFQYVVSDQQSAYAQALAKAMDNARFRANEIAHHEGLELGDILFVSEQSSYSVQPVVGARMKMSDESANFLPGREDISAQIRVHFSIR